MRVGDTIFHARVAVVAVSSDGRVLLHRTAGEDLWSLPGGRLRVGESVEDAARREMLEEADMKVVPGPVLWVQEHFFEHRSAIDGPGRGAVLKHHELGVYVAATVPPRFERRDSFGGRELAGTEHEFALEFRWTGIEELAGLDVRPASMLGELRAQLSARR
ncbi:MAG: NUDIX domain-containing protein [Dehalococcoidia bacterium]